MPRPNDLIDKGGLISDYLAHAVAAECLSWVRQTAHLFLGKLSTVSKYICKLSLGLGKIVEISGFIHILSQRTHGLKVDFIFAIREHP